MEAREAPLAQTRMAATMLAEMNTRELDQIDIIRTCDEILNPSSPMTWRLSEILLGGVVTVYERKVRLLYDEVNSLLAEINSAYKVKPAVDPTVFLRGEVQAKFNSVTLLESADFGDFEPSFDISVKHTTMGFKPSGSALNDFASCRPADVDSITSDDNLESVQAGPASSNRYGRFDNEGGEEKQFYFPSQEHPQKPPTPVHSPPPEMQPQRDDILKPEKGKHSHRSSAEQGDAEQPLTGFGNGDPAERLRSIIQLEKYSLEDTCHSMQFLGLVSEEDDISSYYPRGKDLKVAIIDQGVWVGLKKHKYDKGKRRMIYDNESLYLNRLVWSRPIHECRRRTKLSNHGIFCASVLVGRNRKVNLMNVCEGIIRGVVPLSRLYTYPLGCNECSTTYTHMVDAINDASKNGVRVISMSLGKYELEDLNTRESDIVGRATLEATRNRVLTCLTAGNNGPDTRTINYGMPWAMNVGACTVGKILTTEILVATDQMGTSFGVMERFPFKGGWINVVDKIEGYSINLFEDIHFYPFRMHENSRDKDAVVYTAYEEGCVILDSGKDSISCHQAKTSLANFPFAAIRRQETNLLWNWFSTLRENMYVKICTSKFKDDPRGIFVPEFSSRGPSMTYPQIVSPDVVAPGVGIIGTVSFELPINSMAAITPIYAGQFIMSGTSAAAPHVAGCAAIVIDQHPEWSVYAVKSALMTTALSLAGGTVPGDEFTYGAGVVQPMKAIDPGLIYDEVYDHFDRYMKGQFPVHNLNIPSFAAAFVPSPQHVELVFERELTFVGQGAATYKSKLEVFARTLDHNVSIDVYPNKLSFKKKGDKAKFAVRVRVLPRSEGHVSARLTWSTRNRCDVVSPMILYADTTDDDGAKETDEIFSIH